MEGSMGVTISHFLQKYGENKIVIAIIGVVVGIVLTKVVPAFWNLLLLIFARIGKIMGGSFAYRDFQKRYLDWVVTEHRELKLTGVVTSDEAKKPRLEQVFVSLRVGRKKEGSLANIQSKDKFNLDGPIPSWKELRELLQLQLDIVTSSGTKVSTKKLLSEIKGEERAFRKKLRASGSSSEIMEEESKQSRKNWIERNELADDVIGYYQLRLILREQNRVAVLGAPGAGKTTLLQYVALTHARERAADPKLRNPGILKKRLGINRWRLPIFIRLSSIASLLEEIEDKNRDPSLIEILPRILPPDLQANKIASGYFTHHLKKGNCLILLDGLDEVPTEREFKAVVRAIESLCISYRSNQFMITSRIAGWRSGVNGDFEIYYVNDLTDSQVNTFIDTWYSAVERNAIVGRIQDEGDAERSARERRSLKRAEDLKTTLSNNVGIRRLATNPMLLSIIAVVHRSLATLPKERSKLYAQCSKILLEQWDISRGVQVDDTNLKLEQKEAIMRRLAVAFHTGEVGDKSGGREANLTDIQKIISGMLPSLGRPAEDATHLLQMLVERSGIIIERQRGILSFAHHTFQEYFTAQHLAINEYAQHRDFLLRPENILSDWWREVILLYSGLLSDSSSFIHSIYQPPPEDLCEQKLRLAALCLNEAVEVKQVDVRKYVASELLKVRTQNIQIDSEFIITPAGIEYLVQWSKGQEWFTNAAIARAREANDVRQAPVISKQVLAALEDQQAVIRGAAVKSIRHLPAHMLSNELIDSALKLLNDEDHDVRCVAANSLWFMDKCIDSSKINQAILNNIKTGLLDINILKHMAWQVAADEATDTQPFINCLKHLLNSREKSASETAAKLLAKFLNKSCEKQIVSCMTDISSIDSEIYMTVICNMEKIPDSLTGSVVSNILRCIGGDFNPNKASGFIELIATSKCSIFSNDDVLSRLFELIFYKGSSRNDWVVFTISRMAKNYALPTLRDKLTNFLNSSIKDLQLASMQIISTRGSLESPNEIVEKLLSLLSYPNSFKIRWAAINALVIATATTYEGIVIEKLVALTTRSHRVKLRCAALRSIGIIGAATSNSTASTVVLAALKDKSYIIRQTAIEATIKMDRVLASEVLIKKLFTMLSNIVNEKTLLQSIWQKSNISTPARDLPVKSWYEAYSLMGAIASLGAQLKSEDVFIELLKIVKQHPPLLQENDYPYLYNLAPFARFSGSNFYTSAADDTLNFFPFSKIAPALFYEFTSIFKTGLDSRIFISDRYRSIHPLVYLVKQLPERKIANELVKCLNDSQEGIRILGLELIMHLNGEIFENEIASALQDKVIAVRKAAMVTADAIACKNKKSSILLHIGKRLGDDDLPIREMAWDTLYKSLTTQDESSSQATDTSVKGSSLVNPTFVEK